MRREQVEWKVGDKVIIPQLPLCSGTYTNLRAEVVEMRPVTTEITVAVEGLSDEDIAKNDLEVRRGMPVVWLDFSEPGIRKKEVEKK